MTLLLIHAFATWFMLGLIWFVQIVHYPLFNTVGEKHFPTYESKHQRRTTYVVFIPMTVELITAIWLIIEQPSTLPTWSAYLGLALVILIWLSTAVQQVPAHRKLERGFDTKAHHQLVTTNWLRTAAWSARGVLVAFMLLHVN